MKLKIRGLVFVGFAAAVFAQSASAGTVTGQNDANTVTSKKYVDDKVPATASITYAGSPHNESTENAVVVGTGNVGQIGFKKMSDTATGVIDQTNTGLGSNILVTGKAVAEALNAQDIDGNLNHYTQKVAVYNTTGDPTSGVDYYELIVPDTKVANIGVTIDGTQTNQITASNTNLATAKAVYEYSETLANKLPSNGTTTTINSGSTDDQYPSAKNVYLFMNGYQPKVVDGTHTKIYVGRDDGTAGATWGELSGATNGYVAFTGSDGDYTVDIDSNKVSSNATDIVAAANVTTGTLVSANATDLTTVNAVHEYAVRRNWGSDNNGKQLVINSSGYVDLADSTMPTIPDECKDGVHHCALVTNSAAQGQVALQWTVMAPTGN